MNDGIADCGRASNGRYSRGCRCDACRHAHVMAWKRRQLRKSEDTSYFVDAAPVRARLEALYAVGYSRRELARMGISRSTQRGLMGKSSHTGRPYEKVSRKTAENVEAVQGRALGRGQLVPADAVRVLLDRYVAHGMSVAALERATGINRQTLDKIIHGKREQVEAITLVKMLAAKTELDETLIDERYRLEESTRRD